MTLTKSSKFQEDAVNIDKYNPYKKRKALWGPQIREFENDYSYHYMQ